MYVFEILDEAVEATGIPPGPLLYKKLSRAVKALSNKGNWDAAQLYLDIAVQPGEPVVILPRELLSPIKININKNPAFSRSRLYEFSLSGPGEQDGGLTGWQWMDQNTVPLLADLPKTGTKLRVEGDFADNGKQVFVYGLDRDNREIADVLIIGVAVIVTGGGPQPPDPAETRNEYVQVRRIRKDVTTKMVKLTMANGDIAANYYPDETEPRYRKIKLSKKARSVHMLFKRTSIEVKGPDDYIPLDSEDAVIFMLKANELAKTGPAGPSDESENWEKKALGRLQEEQASRNVFATLATADEMQPAHNLNINNRDSLIAADVIDDVFEAFGPIGLPKAFDRVTDSLEILDKKSLCWDGRDGYIDLNVGWGGEVTMPRYVHRPIKINMGCCPMRMRNRWFEFHLNGPGDDCRLSCDSWDDLGQVVTVNDPPRPFRLVAINDVQDDEGATVRVYGYDPDGKWIRTPNPDLESDDKYIDGVFIVANYANTLPDPQTPLFSRITRVTREETNGYQQLLAYMEDEQEPVLVGYYYPDETEPRYSRIRLPSSRFAQWSTLFSGQWQDQWIRMRYKKRDLKIRSLTDPLHLKSRFAVVDMLWALKTKREDPQKSKLYETQATEYLKEAESSDNPAEQFSIEVGEDFGAPGQGQF